MPLDCKTKMAITPKSWILTIGFKKMPYRKNCSFKKDEKKLTVSRRLAKILTVKKILAAKPLQKPSWDPLNSAWGDIWVAPFHIYNGLVNTSWGFTNFLNFFQTQRSWTKRLPKQTASVHFQINLGLVYLRGKISKNLVSLYRNIID